MKINQDFETLKGEMGKEFETAFADNKEKRKTNRKIVGDRKRQRRIGFWEVKEMKVGYRWFWREASKKGEKNGNLS